MKITEDVRKYAARQELSEEQALHVGMEQKSREFSEAGAEIYSKAMRSAANVSQQLRRLGGKRLKGKISRGLASFVERALRQD